MSYTVAKLANVSKVSVRTLHWYDEIGLLKPAYTGANGYRYYEEKQLLELQQILFFRELGFDLAKIQQILKRGDFDQIAALRTHRRFLQRNQEKMEQLIETIDKTIEHLNGKHKMKEHEFYNGFDKEKQKEYEKQLIDRFGEKVKKSFAECERNVKDWKKADWEKRGEEFKAVGKRLAQLLEKGIPAHAKETQEAISRHFQWLKQFWTPNKESYPAHGLLIVETDLRKAYEAFHPQMPEFIAEAMRIFAENELS